MCCRLMDFFCVLSLLCLTAIKAVPLTSTRTPPSMEQKVFKVPKSNSIQWTPRTVWNAAPPRHITAINSAVSVDGDTETSASSGVPYVIIHHTATRECEIERSGHTNTNLTVSNSPTWHAILLGIQHVHQVDYGWDDIGYNFLIGGDTNGNAEIFEGRGFNVSGAHTRGYNGRSIGIALIGNWTDSLPYEGMLNKLKALIIYGVDAGYINPDYKLLGHRQLSATECPGRTFYEELKKWPHFKENPVMNH